MRSEHKNSKATWIALVALSTLLGSACDCGTTARPTLTDGGADGSVPDGGNHGGDGGTGLPIGSACTDDSQCGGVANPDCLAGIFPLSDIPGLETAGLTFAGGYCSAVPSCASDADCDPAHGGKCFRPFHNSTAPQWTDLEASAQVASGFLANLLIPYGVCLKTCAAETDCRDPGYRCELPLNTLLSPNLLPGVTLDNTQTFCVQPAACFGKDCGGSVCDSVDGTTPVCLCPAGFVDDGGSCVPTCTPTCGANAACQLDTANNNAHVCVCDAGFTGDGATCAPTCAPTCGTNATCTIDTANNNAHVCTCDTGFSGDGQTCLPVCAPACGAHATCQLGGAGNVCACDTGFEFDGSACIVPACQGTCGTNASFVRVGGTGALRCECDTGFLGDGFACAALSCASPCGASATCTANADRTAASCVCNVGFGGDATSCTALGAARFVDNVASNAMDSGDCSASAMPCLTVGYAVAQATAGDVIHVAAGTYPELVVVDKSLTFLGANAGVNAGVGATSRGAESTVIGFRSPEGGGAHPTSAYAFDVTIDGFTLTPQGNQQVLSWSTYDMVSLYGGPVVRVVNNVFNGGTWNVDCLDADDTNDPNPRVLLCKDMADSALMIQSGRFEISGNSFQNFRRPVDIAAWGATASDPAVPPHGVIAGNAFGHVSIRGIWLLDRFGGTVTIAGNEFEGSDDASFTHGVAAIIVTSGGNDIRGNTFNGWSSAVFAQVCDGSNTASYAANTYTNNGFTANRSGIHYYQVGTDASCQVSATIRGNDFVGSTRYAVRWNGDFSSSNPPGTLDAASNWFGDAAGAEVVPYAYDASMDTSPTRDNVTPFVTITTPYTVSGGCAN